MGKTFEYLKCPLCNMNRPRNKEKKGASTFHFYAGTEIIHVREAKGRGDGGGFQKIEGSEIVIADLPSQEPEIYANLLAETRGLLAALESAEALTP